MSADREALIKTGVRAAVRRETWLRATAMVEERAAQVWLVGNDQAALILRHLAGELRAQADIAGLEQEAVAAALREP